jgi:Aerotolerance regulator N-terminal/von Willebrand factor type A domain
MTLLQPAMLWSLLVLAPLAAIYFLKVRPRRKPTTAYFLWDRIFQERRASSLFQRLRDVWSLLLMILAAAAICFALARPEWSDERKDFVLVIDTSASMDAREDRASRLELAKQLAGEIVEGLNGNQRGAVATIDRRLVYRSHLTENPRELLDAIDLVAPSGAVLDVAALPGGNDEDKQWARDHRVIFISDGAFDPAALPPHVELVKVGSTRNNLGIVAADLAYPAGSSNRLGFYYQVASTFAEPKQIDLTLSHVDDTGQEQLFKVIPLTVPSGTNPPETFELESAPAGRWIARLDGEDALAEDNTAYLAVAAPEPIRVAVDSSDPFFFENSVQAFSRGAGLLALVRDGVDVGKRPTDVVLAKSTTPDAANAVIFQPAGESIWWSDLGDEVETGTARVLVEGHPALRHVDAASIPLIGARQLTPPPGAQILVADDKGLPIIYKARHGKRTALVVNIDPAAAEFYFSAWFPVLVHSAATHLAGRENPLAAGYRPGEAVPIPGGKEDVVTSVAAPESDEPVDARGSWFSDSERLGFYRLENSSGRRDFGVNVFSSAESLLNNDASRSNHEPLSRGRSPAQWLTLLAIVVLSAESLLYHRRKVG